MKWTDITYGTTVVLTEGLRDQGLDDLYVITEVLGMGDFIIKPATEADGGYKPLNDTPAIEVNAADIEGIVIREDHPKAGVRDVVYLV